MLTNVFPTYCLVFISVLGYFRFPYYDKEQTEGVTGQQRMLTPPRHLILPLITVEVHACFARISYISFRLLILNPVLYPLISFFVFIITISNKPRDLNITFSYLPQNLDLTRLRCHFLFNASPVDLVT